MSEINWNKFNEIPGFTPEISHDDEGLNKLGSILRENTTFEIIREILRLEPEVSDVTRSARRHDLLVAMEQALDIQPQIFTPFISAPTYLRMLEVIGLNRPGIKSLMLGSLGASSAIEHDKIIQSVGGKAFHIDPYNFDAAERYAPTVEKKIFTAMDARKLGLADNSIDVVLADFLFRAIITPSNSQFPEDIVSICKEAHRVTNDNGAFLIIDTMPEWLGRRGISHQQYLNTLASGLIQAGFTDVLTLPHIAYKSRNIANTVFPKYDQDSAEILNFTFGLVGIKQPIKLPEA